MPGTRSTWRCARAAPCPPERIDGGMTARWGRAVGLQDCGLAVLHPHRALPGGVAAHVPAPPAPDEAPGDPPPRRSGPFLSSAWGERGRMRRGAGCTPPHRQRPCAPMKERLRSRTSRRPQRHHNTHRIYRCNTICNTYNIQSIRRRALPVPTLPRTPRLPPLPSPAAASFCATA
jgi:hypothetical protein